MAGCPQVTAPLLHGVDGARADKRPHGWGEGGLGARWEAHEPNMLPGNKNARQAQLKLVPNCPGRRAIPKDMAAP
jgi:hypothetical protein